MANFYGYKKLKRPADWKGLAGSWTPGRSAYELARAWQGADGLPPEVRRAIEESKHEQLADLKIDLFLVEKPVFLDTSVAPSMTDIMAYGKNSRGEPVVMGVEGKADEPFALRVSSWIKGDVENPPPEAIIRPTRMNRLAFLCELLGVGIGSDSKLRYQLIHRTVSVVLEAGLHGAEVALVLVHAFGNPCQGNWVDYGDFLKALGLPEPVIGKVSKPAMLGKNREVQTFFLWLQDPGPRIK